jgi:type I restriction enzyme, S subunit
MTRQMTRKGYKQTELGEIPEDWSYVPIGRLTENIIDYRGLTPRKLGMDWGGGAIAALSAGNVKKGYIDLEAESYLGSEALYKKWMRNGHARQGDIAFTMEAPLGNAALIPDERKYILSQRTILLQFDSTSINSRYVFQLVNSNSFQKSIADKATGSTAQGIKRSTFEQIKLQLPSLQEQTSIANALSDVDNLIASQEKLITKKQAIKTATMQQLLTGKTRLPGFDKHPNGKPKGMQQTELGAIPEDWEVATLGEACTYINDGTHHTPSYVDSGIPFYSVETISNDDFHNSKFITKRAHDLLVKRCKPEKGDILMTRIGTLALTKLIHWNVDASIYVSLALLKLSDRVDSRYLYCYTKSKSFVKEVERRSLLNATPQKINMADINAVPFVHPKDRIEQTAIANVLSDMDQELDTLSQRRRKTQEIKQGMMQELLTGRSRLV